MSQSFARINKTKRVHLAAIERLLEICTAAHRSAVEAAAIEPSDLTTAAADDAFQARKQAIYLSSRRKP